MSFNKITLFYSLPILRLSQLRQFHSTLLTRTCNNAISALDAFLYKLITVSIYVIKHTPAIPDKMVIEYVLDPYITLFKIEALQKNFHRHFN